MNTDAARNLRMRDDDTDRLLIRFEVSAASHSFGEMLQAHLSGVPLAHLFVFSAKRDDLHKTCRTLAKIHADIPITGCTTAGQIGQFGYSAEDTVLVVGLPASHFATATVEIPDLDDLDDEALADKLVQTRSSLSAANPDKPNGFGFLLVDGLSLREDALAAIIAPAMGSWQVFGGSSGDGVRFQKTWLAHGASLSSGSALLTFVSTTCEARVFSLNHMEPTDRRMVVTRADPARRIVKEINAAPAAREYARFVNKDPEQLDEFTFSAHPVVVRLGDTHHVRAIQRVNENGELVFFAAIDEGMVLTVADPLPLAQHLDDELQKLKSGRKRVEIFACDCILRRIEAEQNQSLRAVSDVLTRHSVTGFSTYGEQIGPLHVNQTMTGVMLASPSD